MASNEIKLKITIDGKEANATINLTDDNIKELYRSFKYSKQEVNGFTTSLSQGLNNACEMIIGLKESFNLLKSTFGEPINIFVDAEQAETAFEVMLGSTEKAKKMIKELKEYGAQTPLEFTGLRENAKLLLNFGVEAENVLPYLKMLGDISGGNAEKLNSLTLAFA